jgi:hypothetical protein
MLITWAGFIFPSSILNQLIISYVARLHVTFSLLNLNLNKQIFE